MNIPLIGFWGEKGLFSRNMRRKSFLFPSLKVVVEGIGEDKIFEGLELTQMIGKKLKNMNMLSFKKFYSYLNSSN